MSPTRKKMVGLWSRLRKLPAFIAVGVLMAASAVTITATAASASDLLSISQTQCATPGATDGAAIVTVGAPDVPVIAYITIDGIFYGRTNGDQPIGPGSGDTTIPAPGLPSGDHVLVLNAFNLNGTDIGAIASVSFHIDTCVVAPPDPPAIPDPTVQTVYGDWTGPEPSCDAREVTQTRSVSMITTTYTWEWNAETNQYDQVSHVGDPVAGDPESRTLTYDGNCTTPVPAAPTVVVKCDHCSDADAANGTATITVTNTADDTKADATYSVTLNGVTKSITVADGESGNVDFSGLAPGTYDVTVAGSDDTSTVTSVTIDKCGVTPPILPKDASASITVAPATCEAAGSVNWGDLVSAVATDLNQSVGTHVATSPAVEGHLFADGQSAWKQEYTIQAQLTGSACTVTPPPVTPPVVTPPVTPPTDQPVESTDDGTHTTPTKVQTDGDTSSLGLILVSLLAVFLIAGGSATTMLVRRRS